MKLAKIAFELIGEIVARPFENVRLSELKFDRLEVGLSLIWRDNGVI